LIESNEATKRHFCSLQNIFHWGVTVQRAPYWQLSLVAYQNLTKCSVSLRYQLQLCKLANFTLFSLPRLANILSSYGKAW